MEPATDGDMATGMRSTFVTCEPAFLDNAIPNNVYMGRGKGPQKIDRKKACASYHDFVRMLRALGVEVLEVPPEQGCQDQSYTANVGIWMTPETGANGPHLVVANFKAAGREVEEEPALRFFHELGLSPKQCPYDWEGEADLKYLKPGLYAGGIGQFSDPKAYRWIADKTGVEIIQVKETSKKLYHLDCSLMRLDDDNILVTPEGLDGAGMDALRKHYGNAKTEKQGIWKTPPAFSECGFTNCVLIPDKRVIIHEVYEKPEQQEWMTNFCRQFGLIDWRIEIGEFEKSGADWSCCHMHLDGWRQYSTTECEERHGHMG